MTTETVHAPWVRYRLEKGGVILTFRVPEDTPVVLDEAGWNAEREPTMDVALVAERRLTVERIRKRVEGCPCNGDHLQAILDEAAHG